MKVSMPRGRAHGWGIAGEYLTREISGLPHLEGVTLHCMKGHDLQPLDPDAWDQVNIGYCFFEDALSVLTHARAAGQRWDMIVTGSRWCEYLLRGAGVRNCATILQGVDSDGFYPGPKRGYENRFVVFSGGKFEIRKGQDVVIAAMRHFMARHDDVLLSCAWHNQWPFSLATMELSPHINFRYREAECSEILAETLAANGIPLDRVLMHPPRDNSLMREIYLASDIGLFPNRCEGGNNMVMCEYMACGRSVIASDMTGHNDVITPHNAFALTRYTPRHYRHAAEGFWYEPDPDELLELLEYAYQHRREGRIKGLRGVADMARLSWTEAARRFHAIGHSLIRRKGPSA
ncbi:glycosyltransferase involved in cell wall biosynthesis [Geobacter argillaceus]|uniref:Glycosyltransferase involved in cell wall biosynthesis n=2 Tax=Geobacter argillaceus TaxID=345631 RepID=A0A562VM17_9BACT|nr:glycosyltransferase involved in cell wall biosynthesis [Geobacter argillaceus]